MTKLTFFAAALALLAAPCSAQLASPEGLKEAVAAGRAMGAAKKAAAAKAAKSFEALSERLIRDGSPAEQPDGVLHALQKVEATRDGQREVIVGVLETAGDAAEGRIGGEGSMVRDLVDRHTYSAVKAQVMTVAVGKDGKARLDVRVYVVDMGGRVVGGTVQSNDEGVVNGGEVTFDSAKSKSRAMAPGEAKAGWDALLPELSAMYKVIEA